MAFNKVVPDWHAAGSEPPESLKQSGFTAGYKPPADFFNWFWHGVSEALLELQAMSPEDIGAMKNGIVPISDGGTGATEVGGAIQNLLIRNTINATSVIDCNALTGVGIYKVYIDASGDPADYHLPARYGILFILSSMEWTGYDYVSQLFYDVLNNALYQRTSSDKGATWKDWIRFYAPNYKPSASDIGAAASSHTHNASDINTGTVALEYGGTGASRAVDATKNILFRGMINVESGIDCNTITNTGIYKVYIDASGDPANHNLPTRYGILFVLSSMEWTGYDYVSQLYYDTLNNTFYQRTSTTAGAEWKAWSKAYTETNEPIPTAVNIDGTNYTLRTGTEGAEGYITFVLE